jgi:hypothetical protein
MCLEKLGDFVAVKRAAGCTLEKRQQAAAVQGLRHHFCTISVMFMCPCHVEPMLATTLQAEHAPPQKQWGP